MNALYLPLMPLLLFLFLPFYFFLCSLDNVMHTLTKPQTQNSICILDVRTSSLRSFHLTVLALINNHLIMLFVLFHREYCCSLTERECALFADRLVRCNLKFRGDCRVNPVMTPHTHMTCFHHAPFTQISTAQ